MTERAILAFGTALAAVGLWLILPGSSTQRRTLGGICAIVGFGFLASQLPIVGDWFAGGMFRGMAAVTVIAALATISFRSPVYCAIWFGMALAGTAGLFLLAGAEFLAVATIVVYAGAILVTFLFVLMLSEPRGRTASDRHSWEAKTSAFTGAVLVGILTSMIGVAMTHAGKVEEMREDAAVDSEAAVAPAPVRLPPPKVANIGAVLFTQYLVAVEAAGALLFAALVGAAVIVTQGRAAMQPVRSASLGRYSTGSYAAGPPPGGQAAPGQGGTANAN
jgi:NADH-quinone oxidoreductase subunit J